MPSESIQLVLDKIDDAVARGDKVRKEHSDKLAELDDAVAELQSRTSQREIFGGGRRGVAYKTYHSDGGLVVEVPSGTRLSDVPELRHAKHDPNMPLERWLPAAVLGEKCRDKEAREYAAEIGRKSTTTGTSGLVIPAEYIGSWWDLIRARSVLNIAGATTVTMTAKTQVSAAVTADPTAAWHTEAASITATDGTFAARTLTAQTLAIRCQASMEVAEDSPDFGRQLANVMTGAMAAELDRVGLEGTGTPPQPRGIKNTSGRLSVTSVGTLTDYAEIIQGLGKLLGANADLEHISKFAIMSPGSWTAFENLATGITNDKTQLPRPKSIEQMAFLVTSNVSGQLTSSPPVNTTIFLGDFRDLTLGVRLESAVEVIKASAYPGNLLLDFVGFLRADWLVRRPLSFCTLEGVQA